MAGIGEAGVEACGMATALANIRSARPRTPPTISAWYRTGTWLWKAGGPCRQAGQGVAGIGEAGVEACGEATALANIRSVRPRAPRTISARHRTGTWRWKASVHAGRLGKAWQASATPGSRRAARQRRLNSSRGNGKSGCVSVLSHSCEAGRRALRSLCAHLTRLLDLRW